MAEAVQNMMKTFRNLVNGKEEAEEVGRSAAAAATHSRNETLSMTTERSRINSGGLRVYKIVVLGADGVGKSALVDHFVRHDYVEYHEPTVGEIYRQQKEIDGEMVFLDILDTGKKIDLLRTKSRYLFFCEGFAIVYSLNDYGSFAKAAKMVDDVRRMRFNENVPIVLVGNKMDLETERMVFPRHGMEMGAKFNCLVFETSAIEYESVIEPFHALVRAIRDKEEAELRNTKFGLKPKGWTRLRNFLSSRLFKDSAR